MSALLHIVVVEDHDALREMTVAALAQPGWHVMGFESAEALCEACEALSIDIAVLDLNLPGEDGLTLAHRLRVRKPNVGIVMLTVRDSIAQRVAGYEHGADIYLPKPASGEELVAAVAALARRVAPVQRAAAPDFHLDLATLKLRGPRHSVDLLEAEAVLLRAFALALEGKLESWQMQQVLNEPEASRVALAIRITRLRKKLAEAGAPQDALRAVRGEGYRLLVDLRIV